MVRKIGTIEPCPDQTELCEGQFKRASAAQVRCKECTKWWKRERSKNYQRNKRRFPEIMEEAAEKRRLDKSKQYVLHPCWCCGQPTRRRALCDTCYADDGKKNHGSEGTCYLDRAEIDRIEQRWRKAMEDKMKTYSCDEYTQEELWELIPNNGTEKKETG